MNTEWQERTEGYIRRIEGLDPGELAKLRRGCGARDPVEGRCPWLIGHIHGAAPDPLAFLVASLLAQHKTADIHAGRHRLEGNFGATWKRAVAGAGGDSIRRRFHILLDADYDPTTGEGDLPHRLRQMVRYAASHGIGVDWPQLLTDLRFWNRPEKSPQKRWARSFFANENADTESPNPENKE